MYITELKSRCADLEETINGPSGLRQVRFPHTYIHTCIKAWPGSSTYLSAHIAEVFIYAQRF